MNNIVNVVVNRGQEKQGKQFSLILILIMLTS
jgi:hypothetical protein